MHMTTNEAEPFAALGARLKSLRLERDLSQEALAAKAGCSHRTLQYLETGKRAPQLETLQGLSRALDVPYEELRAVAGRVSADEALTERELDLLADRLVVRLAPLLESLIREALDRPRP